MINYYLNRGTVFLTEWMSIKPTNYLSCANYGSNLLGKTKKRTQIGRIGRILVVKVIHIWICLRCCQIQDERIYIREVREIEVLTIPIEDDICKLYKQRIICL